MLQQQPSLEFESPGTARPEPRTAASVASMALIARPRVFGEGGWGTILNNLSAPSTTTTRAKACVSLTSCVIQSRVACRHMLRARVSSSRRCSRSSPRNGSSRITSRTLTGASLALPHPLPSHLRRGPLPRQGVFAVPQAVSEHTAEVSLIDNPADRQRRVGGRTVEEVLKERAVPELHGRIDPRGLLAQSFEALAMQWLTVDENVPVCRSMPSKEKPDQARLASARRANDSHVASRLDPEINPLQDRVPGHPYAHPLRAQRLLAVLLPGFLQAGEP